MSTNFAFNKKTKQRNEKDYTHKHTHNAPPMVMLIYDNGRGMRMECSVNATNYTISIIVVFYRQTAPARHRYQGCLAISWPNHHV